MFTLNRRNRNYDKTFEAVIAAELTVLFRLSSIAVRVMRASIAVCVAFWQSKPMNFVPDGVHRMFQLTHRGPPELRSNSRRMLCILHAWTWDTQSIFDSDMSSKVYTPRPRGDPREWAPEFTS